MLEFTVINDETGNACKDSKGKVLKFSRRSLAGEHARSATSRTGQGHSIKRTGEGTTFSFMRLTKNIDIVLARPLNTMSIMDPVRTGYSLWTFEDFDRNNWDPSLYSMELSCDNSKLEHVFKVLIQVEKVDVADTGRRGYQVIYLEAYAGDKYNVGVNPFTSWTKGKMTRARLMLFPTREEAIRFAVDLTGAAEEDLEMTT